MKKILEIKNLTKEYKKNNIVLDKINMSVNEGDFIAIMGPSGSGKTTLLNIVATIDKATLGNVIINDNDITSLKEKQISKFRGEKLGFIFQDNNLLDTLTVKENIALPLAIKKISINEIDKKIDTITKKLGISELLNSYPSLISGGQQQRVSIARAFIKNPDIIMADEPTGALDSKSSKMVLESLYDFNKEYNQTILCVTHDAFSASFASKVLFIKDGKIIKELSKNENSQSKFCKLLLETVSEVIEV